MPETFRAVSIARSGDSPGAVPFDLVVLAHDERRIRRRSITLQHGDIVLVDFPEPVTLNDRDRLVLADGRHVEIIAAEERLLEIRGRDTSHIAELSWHIGNRHAKAEIVADAEGQRILILRDHVLATMLRGLGAKVAEVSAPFSPLEGAYAHAHGEPQHALLAR
jgi:urease accessory protein